MRFVPIKADDQLDLQAMHRVRDRLISRRTAVIYQIRAFLLERGMVSVQKAGGGKIRSRGRVEVISDLSQLLSIPYKTNSSRGISYDGRITDRKALLNVVLRD